MEDSSVTDSDVLPVDSSVASVLGIKGGLRFRPHGSTHRAHIILRRVTVTKDSSDDGEVCNVVHFRFFAHKRFEIKPGKEMLLTVASHDGQFPDKNVILEGDVMSPEDASDEEDNTQVADEEDHYLPPIGDAIPPKMRRAWTKKVEDLSPAIPIITERPAVTYTSIGIQVEPLYTSTSSQTQPSCATKSSQTDILSTSVSVQVDPPPLQPLSVEAKNAPRYASADVQTGETCKNGEATVDNTTLPFDVTGEGERSLSPMELDSPPGSPALSDSSLHGSSSSPSTPGFSPTLVPELIAKLNFPRLPSPTFSVTSSSGVQDMQMSPIDLKAPMCPFSLSPSGTPISSLPNDTKFQHRDNSPRIPTSSTSNLESTHLQPTAPSHPPTGSTSANKVSIRSGKPKAKNPFVSAGFMTEFVAPVDKLLGEKPAESETPIKVKIEEVQFSPILSSASLKKSINMSTPPVDSTSLFLKSQRMSPSSIQRNAVASSSKLPTEKTVPTGPTHFLRLYTSRALEKAPAMSSMPNIHNQTQVVPKRLSPPPDPKSLAYISSGPSSNPLNIRPSAKSTNAFSRGAGKVAPTAPKILVPMAPAKKPMVVGSGWPFTAVKAAIREVPLSTASSNGLSNIISYSSPSPPSSAPPPLPASALPHVPTAAPKGKWKRVANDLSTSPVKLASVSPTVLPRNTDERKKATNRTTPALGKSGKMPLKDRIGPSSATAPAVPTQASSRNLRSRISDPPPTLTLQTSASVIEHRTPFEPLKTPSSPLVSRTPAVPPQTSAPPPITPVTPSLTHPLPPKPVAALNNAGCRSIKRERPKSPDLSVEPLRKKKRRFRWPTVLSNQSAKLIGDGPLGIHSIAFNSDGSHFALSCADRTIRIWNSRNRTEIARLAHISLVVAVAWIDGDAGVVSLAEDGLVSKWTRSGVNHWQWAKVLDAGVNDKLSDDEQVCLAYKRDRIAVSFPRSGVKIWIWQKGTWQAQRSILRQNVTAIKFIDDGTAIVGGTRDGVLWYSEIPNGTLRAYAFLKSKIHTLDVNPSGNHVLVGLGPSAILVGIRQPDNKGAVEQYFTCKETEARANGSFGAIFATEGQAVLFGNVEGCVLVWDRKKAVIVYGLEHDEDDIIQAAASFDGPTNKEGFLVTGTKAGQLSWWSQPVAAPQTRV